MLSIRRAEAAQTRALSRIVERACGPVGGPAPPNSALAQRSLRLEVAARYRMSEHAAGRLMDVAHQAVSLYPASLRSLADGEISAEHLRIIVDEGSLFGLDSDGEAAERRGRYEADVLPRAKVDPPNRLKPVAHVLAERGAQVEVEVMHQRAVARRHVRVAEMPDGMAELRAYLPALEAYGIRDRIRRIAKAALRGSAAESTAESAGESAQAERSGETRRTPDNAEGQGNKRGDSSGYTSNEAPAGSEKPIPKQRTLDQTEADAFCDLLFFGDIPLGDDSTDRRARGIRALVQVIVPGSAVGLGAGLEPGLEPGFETGSGARNDSPVESAALTTRGPVSELVGYGPISRGAGQRVAGSADVWDAVSVDSRGTVLSVDRYRPTPTIQRFLAARDLHCRAPGCRVPVARCDVDHTVAAEHGGPTSTDNLAYLCRGHHTIKHHTGWQVSQRDGGVLTWVSPTGTEHVEDPPSRVRFRTEP
ncbi:DUF222 domain-containing protein [Leucobacter komagatae]